jgi:succinyl-CoA synthetase alpha subunit
VETGDEMAATVVRSRILRDTYRDSVELMRVAAEIERLPGVQRAALLVATPANRDVLKSAGLLDEAATAARPSDLIVAVAGDDKTAAEAALARATVLLTTATEAAVGPAARTAPATIAQAVAEDPAANLALVSTPGPYATAEALKALKRGLHVFLFSDNVSVADELELKRLAIRKRLLVMGPDCGTAILDGVPLGFANAVRRGRIGLVGASGTGLQQVVCLIDRLGAGISQAIGVGGRDLDERIGGLMMLAALDRLAEDADTAVIVLISKPPSPVVSQCVLERARAAKKPIVVCFLGGDPAVIVAAGATPAATLEDAAVLAVKLAGGSPSGAGIATEDEGDLVKAVLARAARLAPSQRAIRGLYSGGTLAYEAALLLKEALPDAEARRVHSLLDLGDNEFTVGRPHPMIDFRLRNERIAATAEDPATAVVLLDVVLGYGSHPDPAGELAPVLEASRKRAARAERELIVIGSVCGTTGDPQGLAGQEARLSAAGVLLAPSNARAARLAILAARDAGGRTPGARP